MYERREVRRSVGFFEGGKKKEIGRGTAVLSRWVEKRGGRREGGGEVFCWLLEGGKKREGERRLCGRGEEKKSVVYVRRKMRKSCFFAGEEKKERGCWVCIPPWVGRWRLCWWGRREEGEERVEGRCSVGFWKEGKKERERDGCG